MLTCSWSPGAPAHPGDPQVLRLESRVLELEVRGDHVSQGHVDPVEVGPGPRQALAQEPSQEAQGPRHSAHHRHQVTLSTGGAQVGGAGGGPLRHSEMGGNCSPTPHPCLLTVQVQPKDILISQPLKLESRVSSL